MCNKRQACNSIMDKRKKNKTDPSGELISYICDLYGDHYDDRDEDSSPGGSDWEPGKKAMHMSLSAFQKYLKSIGIEMSTGKIRKILITGSRWTTARSREVAALYEEHKSVNKVAEILGVSQSLVVMYLPYEKVVYDLEDKSGNAKRMQRWREKHS